MEKKGDRVVAVTVTHNSAVLLKNAITALLNQTYEVDKILIVDNASNEDNKRLINEFRDLSEKIAVLNLKTNSGGAGGFEAGVAYTRDNFEYDWIWLMDDDAYPRENCLETLLMYKNLDNVGCLAPLIYGVDNKEYQLYHHKFVKRCYSKDKIAYSSYDSVPEVSNIDADAFVGPLFSKKVIDELGIPDGSLFIYGDDQEYTYRVSRKYNVWLIKNAVMNHRDLNASMSGSPNAWWKDYYMHRNRLLFVKEFSKNGVERVLGTFFVKMGIYKRVLLTMINKNLNSAFKKKRNELLFQSLRDGTKGKSGKIIDPEEYNKWLNKIEKEI